MVDNTRSNRTQNFRPVQERFTNTSAETANSAEDTPFLPKRAAAGAAAEGETRPLDPDLAGIVEAWPGLPAYTRAAVLAMVQAAR